MKDVQATGEASSPQKRTSSTSKQNFSPFCIKWANFAYLDPDPADQINGLSEYSESTTLKKKYEKITHYIL
jgi:hypothetical protein